jgi:hypothetical protein
MLKRSTEDRVIVVEGIIVVQGILNRSTEDTKS